MACMDHFCHDCHWGWEDNRRADYCPRCESPNVSNVFDEQDDDYGWVDQFVDENGLE